MRHGFDSQERIERWLTELRSAAERSLVPEAVLTRTLRSTLERVFDRTTRDDYLLKRHPGVSTFTIQQIKPKLQMELRRRILASASLIKLNRESSVQRTLQRFAGWASSIPAGGSALPERREAKEQIRRGIAGLPFEERRVIIDQGHKLVSAINDIVATDGGAIAAVWHSHWRESNYNYRASHKERDGVVYLVRGCWALRQGLMKPDGHQYLDEVTQPGQEPFCRCFCSYLYTLRDLPPDMLTVKGRAALAHARAA